MKKFINLMALAALLFVPWTVNAQCDDGTPCQFTITGDDSYGDGWEGNLTIYRNNTVLSTFTVDGSSNTQTFTVCQGDLVRVDWSGQDQYNENNFSITAGDGTVYVSNGHGYTYAPSGTVVEFVACATCIPPTAITASGITSEGLTLSWSDTVNSGASYSIDYWSSNDTTTVTTTDTFYTFTGLDANTGYHFAVKAVCSSTDESLPTGAFFGTACGSSTCELTVRTWASYDYSYYWPTVTLYQNGIEIASVSGGPQSISVCSTDTVIALYTEPTYNYSTPYVSILDGGGSELFNGSAETLSTGDILTTIATPCPSCIPPTALFIDTTDQNSITIGWTPRSGATQFAVYLNGSLVSDNVIDTFYTFTGLNANTAYTLGVQSVCASDDTSNIATFVARTECGPLSVPFFDDFDSYANGFWPPCWHRLRKYGTDPSVNNQFHHSGTQSMFLLSVNDTTLFCTPGTIPLAGNEIQVRYYAFLNWSSYSTDDKWIKAGVMTDTSDMSTFIALDSVGWHNFNDVFEEREFNTSTLDPTATYWVAWMFYSTNTGVYSSTNRGAIDDVSITQLSDCVRPSAASVGTVGARQVELSWNSVDGANGYTVYYGTVNDPTSSSLLSEPATDTAFTLTGLQPETQYYAWVATNCGGTESDLRYAGSFTTLVSCPAVTDLTVDTTTADGATVSWHTGDLETQWLVALDSNDFELVYDTTYTLYGLDPMTGHTVYVRAYCGDDDTSSVQSINFATSCADATCLMTVEMTDSYGDGWNGGAVNFFQAGVQVGSTTISSGNSGTATVEVCSSAAVEVRVTSGSYPSEMSFIVHDGSGSPIYTAAQGSISSSSDGTVIATVNTPCPSCIMPMNLSVDAITATEATIHWVADGQSSWYVILDSGDAVSVTDTFYTFTGLEARTLHTAYVATDCGDDTSSFATISFATDCATGSCNLSVTSTANYAYEVYCPTLHVWQNGVELASVNAATQTVNVCASIPVEIIYNEPTYNWGDNPTAIITDANGDEIFNSNTDNYSNGDTLLSLANACATCRRPTGAMATAADSNSVTFVWDVADSVYGYLVSFDDGAYYSSMSGYESFTGLTPNSEHTFSVRALCSTEDTSNASTVTIRTTCGAMAIPFVEDFESGTAGSAPYCWTVVSGEPEIDDYSNGHSGTNSLLMSGNDMIATSLVPLFGDSIHVSFWAKHSSGTLEAGVMTNPLADTTFIPLVTSTGTSDNYTFLEFNTLSLDHYTNYYVAFRYNAPYYSVYIDDINIRVDDGCLHPSNLVVNTTASSTGLTWHDGTGIGNFVIEYRLTGDPWSAPVDVYDTSYTFTSLNASSSYEVRVGLLCGSDTLWTTASFDTPCGIMPLPYFEDFDAYANDVMPPCWGWSSTSATHWDGGVFLRSYYGGGSDYVVVPELDGNIAKLKIEFDTKVGTIAENDGILIGVANSAGTLLAWLDTIQDPSFSRNAHVHKTVYFPNYSNIMPAGAARVAFAQYRNWNEWALIDNINIEELPDCYPVDNLTGHNLDDPENTTFTWTPQGTASQWQVYVDTVTVDIDSLASMPASAFTTVYDTSYTIPIGLIQGGGIYNFFVRSNCSIDQSNWVKYEFGAGTVIMNQTSDTVTGCGFVVYDNGGPIAGYLANTNSTLVLRSENAGSQLQVFGGKFGFGMDPATLTIYDGEGTAGSVLYTYNTVNGRDTIDSVLCTSTSGSLTITFVVSGTMCHTGYELYIRCTGEASCPRPTELTGEMTSDSVATITWNGTAPSYDFYYRISPDGAWLFQTVTNNNITLTGLVPDTLYDIYVVAHCSATEYSTPSAVRQLDTHYGDAPAPCPAPSDLTVSNITMTSAVVGWTANGSETSWRLEVFNNTTLNTQHFTLNTNPYTLSGLNPGTSYTMKIQALCDATTESDWSNALTFITEEEDTSAAYYTVSVSCNASMGSVTGGGTYAEGSEVTLTATSNPGYRFAEWSDGNTDSVRVIVVTSNINLVAYFESTTTGIEDVENGEWRVEVYPNPASSDITVRVNRPTTLTVIDLQGRTVIPATAVNSSILIPHSSLQPGTYFLRVTGTEDSAVKKLIVR